MASGIYDVFKDDLFNALADLEGDTIKCALYNDSFSFTATQVTYSTTNELSTENGYTQGGEALTNKAVSGASTVKWTADPTQWTATDAGFTAYFALVYDTTNANHCICCIDFGGAKTASGGGTFTITWSGDGILDIS